MDPTVLTKSPPTNWERASLVVGRTSDPLDRKARLGEHPRQIAHGNPIRPAHERDQVASPSPSPAPKVEVQIAWRSIAGPKKSRRSTNTLSASATPESRASRKK